MMNREQRAEQRRRRRETAHRALDKPNAFAPLASTLAKRAAEDTVAEERVAEEALEREQPEQRRHRLRANRVIAVLIIASLGVSAAQIVLQAIFSHESIFALARGTTNAPAIFAIAYFVLVAANVAGLVMLIRYDHRQEIFKARMVVRGLVVLLILGLLDFVILNGVQWAATFYLFQFVCAISYQVYNDPNLARPPRFYHPLKEGREARAKAYELDPARRAYIPLNFFNLFWIFVVASVIGLAMEMVFCLLVNGVWEDRAGLLWGPFSPIYGVGAVFMTVALNRWWYRNVPLIFIVAGLIGAAFEFFVSWYMQTAFGVVAWDYSGSFLSIQGRTDFAHMLAWGLCGVIWIRLLLPTLMRIVDWIPLRWRALLTTVALVFMVINASMTLLALDCWSQRQAGFPVQTEMQQYFAQNFDDAFMQERFATMGMSEQSALRAQTGGLRG